MRSLNISKKGIVFLERSTNDCCIFAACPPSDVVRPVPEEKATDCARVYGNAIHCRKATKYKQSGFNLAPK